MMRANRSYIKICQTSGCGNYTRSPIVDYCASCETAIRKNKRQQIKDDQKRQQNFSKKMEPRAKPKPVSEKRKVINQEYFKLVDQFKKDNPNCNARINNFCTGATDDPHHSRGRGAYLLDVSTWIPVCRSCHNYIEQHPLDAQKRGLSFSRLSTNETI